MSSLILFPTNEYATSSKSSEQIQRLMLSESNTLFDNLQYILNKGHPLQQPYAYKNFHHYPQELLGLVCSRLSKQDHENQIIIGESLKLLMRKTKKQQLEFRNSKHKRHTSIQSRNGYANKIDQIIQDNYGTHLDKFQSTHLNQLIVTSEQITLVFDSALEALTNWTSINNQHLVQIVQVAVQMKPRAQFIQNTTTNNGTHAISLINTRQQLLKTLEQTILSMGKPTQPIISKIISGRLIPIFIKYTGQVIRGEMIDIIKRIIADSQFEAKKIWLQQILPKLLERLKLEYIELHLQQKIYETIYDENQEIGCMALSVVLNNVNKFSVEEQGSRIVKLFIDSLTSKSERIVMMVSGIMGEIYEKLQYIIVKNESNCLKFWKSFLEVAQSRNQKILNNFIYNLPGVLLLSKKYHRVDAVCQIYLQLFYHPQADINLLVKEYHEMVKMFPNKKKLLRETAYSLLSEAFESNTSSTAQPSDQSLKILDCLFANLSESKQAFFEQSEAQKLQLMQLEKNSSYTSKSRNNFEGELQQNRQFDQTFVEYLQKYLILCLNKKNGPNIHNLYESILKCYQHFPTSYIEMMLLPKLYNAIRLKTPYSEKVMIIIVTLLSKQRQMINNYASKINVELSKSSKSYEREAAMLFFYYCHKYFSIELFQEFKMGEKYLQFSNEKALKNKILFIRNIPQVMYYFTRQQKIQFTIILNKLKKQYCNTSNDQNKTNCNQEIDKLLNSTQFTQNEVKKLEVQKRSKKLRQNQKNLPKGTNNLYNSKKILYPNKRGATSTTINNGNATTSNNDLAFKDLRKEDILKKRLQTKSRSKIVIKDRKEGIDNGTKRKTPSMGNRSSLVNKKN